MKRIKQISCESTIGIVQIPDNSNKYIVLYFYPKDNTPGCTIEGRDFAELNEQFKAKNIIVYGVSKDSINSHKKFISKQGFNFALISDTDGSLCSEFGVIQMKKMFGKEYMGIVRSTFVIAPDGKILKHWSKVKVKGHAKEVLDYCNTL